MKASKKQIASVTFLFAMLMAGIALMPATASAQTQASVATYMYIDGIQGASTDAKHPGWINVASFLQQMQNPSLTVARTGGGTAAPAQPSCSGIDVIKGLDIAGPALWSAAMNGKMLNEVRIEVMMNNVKAYEIRMNSVRISSIMSAGSFQFAETVTFLATSVKLTSYPQTGAPSTYSFLCY
jgi:type VI secretion system secreted protein Hcp